MLSVPPLFCLWCTFCGEAEAFPDFSDEGDMAPKKLEPLPPGVSPATLVSEETVADRPEFRTFRRWYSPQQFLETLRSGGQVERLRLQRFVNPDFRVQEARIFDLLYPGLHRPDLRLYTPVEVELFRPGRSSLLWPSRPPLPQHFNELRLMDFMAWITIPGSTFTFVMERAQQTGLFTLSATEVLGAPEHINFSLSPRSALLLYSFQLSISERGGRRYTLGGPQDNLVTIGLQFPVDLFESCSGEAY